SQLGCLFGRGSGVRRGRPGRGRPWTLGCDLSRHAPSDPPSPGGRRGRSAECTEARARASALDLACSHEGASPMDRELTCRLGRSAGRIAPCLVLAARWLAVAALIVGLTLAPTWPFDGAGAQAADFDLDVPGGGHFYTQTNGGAGMNGYAVTNSDGVPFWTF